MKYSICFSWIPSRTTYDEFYGRKNEPLLSTLQLNCGISLQLLHGGNHRQTCQPVSQRAPRRCLNSQSDKQEIKQQWWAGAACSHSTGRSWSSGAQLPRVWICCFSFSLSWSLPDLSPARSSSRTPGLNSATWSHTDPIPNHFCIKTAPRKFGFFEISRLMWAMLCAEWVKWSGECHRWCSAQMGFSL